MIDSILYAKKESKSCEGGCNGKCSGEYRIIKHEWIQSDGHSKAWAYYCYCENAVRYFLELGHSIINAEEWEKTRGEIST